MHQGEKHGAGSGDPGPAVGCQEFPNLQGAAKICQGTCGGIGHENDRHDNLVGRKPQNKGHEDDSVHTEEPGGGVQKVGAEAQQGRASSGNIGQQPDDQSGRGGDCDGAAKNEKGPVKNGADDDLTDLWAAIGRQFQSKGRGNPFEQGFGEQAGEKKGHKDSQDDDAGQQQRGKRRGPEGGSSKKNADQQDQGGKASVAGDKDVGEDGNQPLPGRVDDPGAGDAYGVAPQAHEHGVFNSALYPPLNFNMNTINYDTLD